ncbi:hypothetical protein BOTBODRAFT_174026 [Botryobasidium botryosum FD-172 SS1]|uniref:Reverse transcriptase domain-containing protein n=1 Tax=Botryobasidium botryosum (strain FD-172 SS1) TaxID=930990 RepID=A0A067MUB4_BOTB1|nr:hypothetical protein BOTBODRAFT_174026 [Botryobasidium botryosum FD-172 SS1]
MDDGLIILSAGHSCHPNVAAAVKAIDIITCTAAEFGLSLDQKKTEMCHLISQKRKPTPAPPAGSGITVVDHLTWLGVTLSNERSLRPHLDRVLKKANYAFHNIALLTAQRKLKAESSIRLYCSIVRPTFTYGCQAGPWFILGDVTCQKAWWEGQLNVSRRLNTVQNRFLRRITGCYNSTRNNLLSAFTGIPPVNTWMDFLTDKYVIQKTNMHASHPLRPLLADALDRPLQGNPVIQQVAAVILDLPSESAPHLGEDFATEMHLRVPPWESPFHRDSSIKKITFDPDHPYRPFHDFLRFCEESQVAPLVAELTPSTGPDADDTWGILRLGILVKQTFSVKPLACLKIYGHLASRPVITASALHLLLNNADFELNRFPSYGLLVSNHLLANCICVHPSRRILPSPPRAYAYLEQRASAKSLFVTAVQQPARRLRPLKAFRRLDPLDPLAPTLAPTLTWRNTNVRGRALLATSLYANDILLDHSASLFGASLRVIWVNMRPRRLQVPIPLTLPGTHFTYAARVFSGHCPSPYYYGKMGLFGYSAACPCGFPIGSSAHIALATSTTGSRASSAPASLPGGGSQTEYWGLQVRLPHGFKWIKIPHNHHTIDLRTAIAIHACAYEEYTPTDLVDNLRAEGLYDVSLADAYYDYYRLRASFRHERDPSVRAVIDRYLTNATHQRDFGPAARGYMF